MIAALAVLILVATSPSGLPTAPGSSTAPGLPTAPGSRPERAEAAIAVDPCVGAARAELVRRVALELGVDLMELPIVTPEVRDLPGGAVAGGAFAGGAVAGGAVAGGAVAGGAVAGRPRLIIRVRCAEPSAWALRVEDVLAGEVLERQVDRATTPAEAEARLLALAIAELVTTHGTEEASPRRRRALRPAEPLDGRILEDDRFERGQGADLTLSILGGAMIFPGRSGVLLGGGFRAARGLGVPWAAWSADLSAFHARRSTPAGAADVNGASLSAALGLEHQAGPGRVAIAVGLRGGVGALAGTSSETHAGQSLLGPWWGPLGRASARVRFFERLELTASGEVGYSPASIVGRVPGGRALEIGGAWCLGELGLGLVIP